MTEFSTLMENAETLENAQKIRKNDRICKSMSYVSSFSTFSTLVENAGKLKWKTQTFKKFADSIAHTHFLSVF